MLQEEQYRGKPNWEHLCEDLHVLIQVEDAKNRAEIKLSRAVTEVKKLLVPAVSVIFKNLIFVSSAGEYPISLLQLHLLKCCLRLK